MMPSRRLPSQKELAFGQSAPPTTPGGVPQARDRSRLRLGLDVAGVLLMGALISWTYVAALRSGGDPGPSIALMLAAVAAFVAARWLSSFHRLIPPAFLLVAAGAVALWSAGDLLTRAQLSKPLGYSNANAAFFVQAAVAALMVTVGAKTVRVQLMGGIAAGVAILLIVAGSSAAATGVIILLPAIALLTATRWGAAGVALICAAVFLAVLAGTIYLGSSYSAGRSDGVQRAGSRALSDRRLVLWHEAIAIIADNPGTGVGPQRFQQVSPTAQADQDARWAHHAFLQVGAEEGLPGLILLVAVFGWGFARLGVSGAPTSIVALGAAGLAAFGIHACLDYIMHFAAVPVSAAGLLGTAVAGKRWDA
jgi:O-antigen ligase/polysaccharide polymerase Wzy-like membrane protein